MAAATSDPGWPRLDLVASAEPVTAVRAVARAPLLIPTTTDEQRMAWFAALAPGEVSGLRSGSLERGGSFTVVDHDKMTVRQEKAANRQRKEFEVRALMSPEHRATIDTYWSPGCDRLMVERARENEERKAAGKTLLAAHSEGERGLRLAALGPFTKAAQEAGETLVQGERLRRANRVKVSPLRLVSAPEAPGAGEAGEDAAPHDVSVAQPVSEALQATLDETAPRDGEHALHFLVRRDAALCEKERQRVQGPWKPAPLAPDQLRDAAVRAIRDAERRKDVVLLTEIRVQAAKAYAAAGDAYVRARRAVKGKDGEEKRQEAADRWTRENACRNLRTEAQDFFNALESSSRIRLGT